MTVRGFLLAGVLMAASPVDAAACHRYSRWFYPWPQRCGPLWQKPVYAGEKPVSSPLRGPSGPDIPLPALDRADFTVAEPDDVTRARLQLMGYAYAH